MDAIALKGVTKRFGRQTAVDDLSLVVPRGSIYGFIGPNGSGKSTTLRMILHIILPDSGTIRVLGDDDTAAARDRIGYLPEERGLYRKMKVGRLLDYFGRLKGRPRSELLDWNAAWLERFQLKDRIHHKVETLSKGMQQKVQFIAAISGNPDLLILDEPFSGLDPVNLETMKDAILELRSRGTTVVLSTHDMSVAERMCDRIFMIFQGRKVLDGTLEEIQSSFGADTVRVRCTLPASRIGMLPGVESVNDYGQMQEVRLRGEPREFLRGLTALCDVSHFEIARPSLHDIFVRIARPGEAVPA